MTWQPGYGVSYSLRTLTPSPAVAIHHSLPRLRVFPALQTSQPDSNKHETRYRNGTSGDVYQAGTLSSILETVFFYILLHSWHSPLVPFPSRFRAFHLSPPVSVFHPSSLIRTNPRLSLSASPPFHASRFAHAPRPFLARTRPRAINTIVTLSRPPWRRRTTARAVPRGANSRLP